MDFCDSGKILVFNITVVYPAYDGTDQIDTSLWFGRTVLYSSGGDSVYGLGGVYAHQVSSRGDNYIELGISYRSNIFSIKVL